jgi:hypothetical protein
VSDFDHRGADVTASGFGDMSGVMGLAAVVDASSQASIADQVLSLGEARDVADGSQEGNGCDQTYTRQLQQEDDSFVLDSQGKHRLLQKANLGLGEQEGVQIAANARQFQS